MSGEERRVERPRVEVPANEDPIPDTVDKAEAVIEFAPLPADVPPVDDDMATARALNSVAQPVPVSEQDAPAADSPSPAPVPALRSGAAPAGAPTPRWQQWLRRPRLTWRQTDLSLA